MDTYFLVFITLFSTSCAAFDEPITANEEKEQDNNDGVRNPKLSIFSVVRFTNTPCQGSSRNGTCYTHAECSLIGGINEGSCADGFGVCCTMTLTTGGTSSLNNSYIQVTSDTRLSTGSTQYTICPCSDDICRIKFDFESFDIVGPDSGFLYVVDTGSTAPWPTTTEEANFVNRVGQCMIDTFQIISTCGRNSPLICGENANQHMILDTCGTECLTVDLGIGSDISDTARTLDILITQYRCGDEQGGPPGCLQYFENTSGKVRSFNFPDASPGTTIGPGFATHLANQQYKVCVRRGNGKEIICWIPCTSTVGEAPQTISETQSETIPTAQPSFGLSGGDNNDGNTASFGSVDTHCSTDYIWIPNGYASTQFTSAISQQDKAPDQGQNTDEESSKNRFCGRYLTTKDSAYSGVSVCSYSTPFILGVYTDQDEVCTAQSSRPGGNASECEGIVQQNDANGGGGQLGFSLCYVQHTPPI